jgi:hypothetical protein
MSEVHQAWATAAAVIGLAFAAAWVLVTFLRNR